MPLTAASRSSWPRTVSSMDRTHPDTENASHRIAHRLSVAFTGSLAQQRHSRIGPDVLRVKRSLRQQENWPPLAIT